MLNELYPNEIIHGQECATALLPFMILVFNVFGFILGKPHALND